MLAGQSRWVAYAFCGALLAACGGGGGDDGGGSETKTFDSPQDGAELSAAIANVLNKIGASAPGAPGKALARGKIRAKTAVPCSDGGTQDFSSNDSTAFDSDGTFAFKQCAESLHDQLNTQLITDGSLDDECTDPQQDTSNCSADVLTFGQGSTPLSLEVIDDTPTDVLAELLGTLSTSFNQTNTVFVYDISTATTDLITGESVFSDLQDFALTATPNVQAQTASVTLDGRIIVDDNGASNCGSGDLTVETVTPLTASASDLTTFTSGQLDLSSTDGSVAHVTYNADGSITVTVDGVAGSQRFTAAQLAAFCAG